VHNGPGPACRSPAATASGDGTQAGISRGRLMKFQNTNFKPVYRQIDSNSYQGDLSAWNLVPACRQAGLMLGIYLA